MLESLYLVAVSRRYVYALSRYFDDGRVEAAAVAPAVVEGCKDDIDGIRMCFVTEVRSLSNVKPTAKTGLAKNPSKPVFLLRSISSIPF